ncbi:hypothetical protein BD626DRAFT_626908 [Schizophyllum amplum]|uniref:Uncharacterized protein n=1 Tax=Schizophyllum amplum TaxID=97359 RepID=A0A550CV14_9AGAR|nr:hypothetical protein BD626DRAFT_626906 [Auriculariopsis ampla]TRM68633.1 hypothetical protein BD626DRAFT_626908 [Auriculariopsis ampla]
MSPPPQRPILASLPGARELITQYCDWLDTLRCRRRAARSHAALQVFILLSVPETLGTETAFAFTIKVTPGGVGFRWPTNKFLGILNVLNVLGLPHMTSHDLIAPDSTYNRRGFFQIGSDTWLEEHYAQPEYNLCHEAKKAVVRRHDNGVLVDEADEWRKQVLNSKAAVHQWCLLDF